MSLSFSGARGIQSNPDKVRKNPFGFGNKALGSQDYFKFSAIKNKLKEKVNLDVGVFIQQFLTRFR